MLSVRSLYHPLTAFTMCNHHEFYARQLLGNNEDSIELASHRPDAFTHICRWIVFDKLNVLGNLLAPAEHCTIWMLTAEGCTME